MVVPIYDDNPFAAPVKPVVTWCLIAVNLAVFFYEAGASQLALDRMIDTFSLTPAASPATWRRGWVPAFATIFTYQFFHADIAHLVGNMVFLWVFGDDVERALGRWRYLAFYLLCGVVGGLVFIAIRSACQDRADRRIGRDRRPGRGLCDAASLRQDHGSARHHPAADQRLLGGRLFVLIQLWNLGASSKSEVAYWCHFGGMLAGGVLFPLIKPRWVKLFQCRQRFRTPSSRSGQSRCPRGEAGQLPLTLQGSGH
jgi:membrane associated rhomboid family serine protease